MSDDDEMEEFDVNDEDLRRAMDSSYRKKGRTSREEAMLGVFASRDEDEDDDSDGNERSGEGDRDILKRFGFKEAPKKTGLINFVSKGSVEKEKKPVNREPVIVDTYVSTEDESDVEESEDKEATSGAIETEVFVEIEKLKPVQNMTGPTFLKSSSTTKKAASLNKHEVKEVGNWEKYEKGFGSKMLLKMGWQKGKGLGKELHGRAVPVEATVRKGKGAVGRYGAESKDVKRLEEDEEEGEGEARPHVAKWKEKQAKSLKYESVRTAEELLAVSGNNQKKLKKVEEMLDRRKGVETEVSSTSSMSRMKIIDMTGPEHKVLHGYESLNKTAPEKCHFDLPELTRNLDILVEMTEQKIIHSEKKLKHFDDILVSLEYEEAKSNERAMAEKAQIERVESLLGVVERCQSLLDTESDLKAIMAVFVELKTDYPDEFLVFNLHQLAIPLFGPVLKQKMSG